MSSTSQPELPPTEGMLAVSRRRWWIIWVLFLSTVINYVNRQTLSILAPVISKQFHMTHEQLSHIFGAFQFSYAVTWLIGGIFLDIIGTRMGLSIAVIWWSLVSIVTSFANSVATFSSLRFLLGIGEGVNWPGASKAVAECFPSQERSIAVAIFDSGSSVGGALAAVAVPWIAIQFGWRSAFVFSGLLGFLWLFCWLAVYPRSSAGVLKSVLKQESGQRQSRSFQEWFALLKRRETWGIVLGRSLTDPVWWFYVFWLPQYLSDARGFSLKEIAAFAWTPFIAADIGNFAGGFASSFLIRKGVPALRARKWICVVSCIPMFAAFPAALVSNPITALAYICIALLGYASWSTMGLTFPSDLFPSQVVGSVTGLSGLGAGLVSTVFTLAVGVLVDRFSYVPAFAVAAVMPVLATISVLVLIRNGTAAGTPASLDSLST
jgi:ACS family hexuronate transporter-like MFS transporter